MKTKHLVLVIGGAALAFYLYRRMQNKQQPILPTVQPVKETPPVPVRSTITDEFKMTKADPPVTTTQPVTTVVVPSKKSALEITPATADPMASVFVPTVPGVSREVVVVSSPTKTTSGGSYGSQAPRVSHFAGPEIW